MTANLWRGVLDFAAVLALFWMIALGGESMTSRAYAVPLPELTPAAAFDTASQAEPASLYATVSGEAARGFQRGGTDTGQALVLLSIAFAAICAFNLAFLRHLRRVYASPRRGVWRRGSQI